MNSEFEKVNTLFRCFFMDSPCLNVASGIPFFYKGMIFIPRPSEPWPTTERKKNRTHMQNSYTVTQLVVF
jgi:hypothetical protein